MKAMILPHQASIGNNPLILQEVPLPEPGDDEVRIRVSACGIYCEKELFYEKNLVSVTANTRKDGEDLLREAASLGLRPRVTLYPFHEANRALQDLKADRLKGSGVLVMSP